MVKWRKELFFFGRDYCDGVPTKYPELLRVDSRLLQGFYINRQARPSSLNRQRTQGPGPKAVAVSYEN